MHQGIGEAEHLTRVGIGSSCSGLRVGLQYILHTVKELLPIVVACAVWGKQWRGTTVKCICDNAAVVAILKSGKSKDRLAMHLVRCLFFFSAHFNIFLVTQHLPGRENVAADALSWKNLPLFYQQVPQPPVAQPQFQKS